MATEIDIAVTTTTYNVSITAEPNEYIVNITTGGSGGVQSVTGTTVDNTDPLNPVVGVPTLQEITDNESGVSVTDGTIQALSLVATEGVQGSQVSATDGVKSVSLKSENLYVVFNDGLNESQLNANGIDGNYDWVLPNQSGTVAMLSDIPAPITIDATPTDGSSNAVSSNGVFDALASKENITAATTGAVISFATPQIYNSIASPSASNITDNLTGARIGVVQKIYHNAGTAPTVPAGWVRRGTGTYVTSTLNIIYAEWSVGTTVEYWITQ